MCVVGPGRETRLAEDPRFLGQGATGEFYHQEVIPAIEGWSSDRPKWEVAGKLTEIGFSMGVAQTVADLARCEHLEQRGMFLDTGDTLGGQFRSLRTPVQLTGCVEPDATTPPGLGEHNSEILGGIGGLTPEELRELEAEGSI